MSDLIGLLNNKLTNDQVRKVLADNNITTENVTDSQLKLLWQCLKGRLKRSGCFRGTFRMNPPSKTKDMRYMTCNSDYFVGREAVSFNRDGFIGFAGWASDENVQPILHGVVEWVIGMTDK